MASLARVGGFLGLTSSGRDARAHAPDADGDRAFRVVAAEPLAFGRGLGREAFGRYAVALAAAARPHDGWEALRARLGLPPASASSASTSASPPPSPPAPP